MSKRRNYWISIRNAAEEYFGGEHRIFAKMSSLETDAAEGWVELQIGRGDKITMTPDEARHIANTLLGAVDGAAPKPTPDVIAVIAIYENSPAGWTNLRDYVDDSDIRAAEAQGVVERLRDDKIGWQDLWRLASTGRHKRARAGS